MRLQLRRQKVIGRQFWNLGVRLAQLCSDCDQRRPLLGGDFVAFPPALDCGVIFVPQLAGYGSNPKAQDDVGVCAHPALVRLERTIVKADCVRHLAVKRVMAENDTIGTKLIALRARSGMTLDAVANDAGYSRRSSIQRYFHRDYDAKRLPYEIALKLTKALAGKGNPPIKEEEVLALSGVIGAQSLTIVKTPAELERTSRLPNDIPIYGTALGSQRKVDSAGGTGSLSVEQAELNTSEVLGYKRRPSALEGQDSVYGVYVSGMSMFPRFSDGEAAIVDPKRPPRIGDDVVIHMKSPDDHDGERVTAVLIKRLVRRNSDFIELQQFHPELTFRVATGDVKWVHRIVTIDDLL